MLVFNSITWLKWFGCLLLRNVYAVIVFMILSMIWFPIAIAYAIWRVIYEILILIGTFDTISAFKERCRLHDEGPVIKEEVKSRNGGTKLIIR